MKITWQDHSNAPIVKEQIPHGKVTDKHWKELKGSGYAEIARKDLRQK